MFKRLFSRTAVILTALSLFLTAGFPQSANAYVSVKGYTRKDGTYVAPYVRSEPNGLLYDNYGYKPSQGLYNPSYGTKGSAWDTPTYVTDPNYYEGLNLYNNNQTGSSYTAPTPLPIYTPPPTPTCPSMATYDAFSDSCKCWSGYVVGKNLFGEEACVLGDSLCHDQLGYMSSYNSLNKNCECDPGYSISNGKCTSKDTQCTDLLGYGGKYNSLKANCECRSGYKFDGNKCLLDLGTAPTYTPPPTIYNCDSYGSNAYLVENNKCRCKEGYSWNSTMTQCIESIVCSDGFVKKDGKCWSYTQDCQLTYGSNSYGLKGSSENTSSCYCNADSEWNSDKSWCLLKTPSVVSPPVPTEPVVTQVPPTPAPVTPVVSKPKLLTCTGRTARSLDGKRCVTIPEHAHAVKSRTDVWACDEGYEESGNICLVKFYKGTSQVKTEEKPVAQSKGFFGSLKGFFAK